MLGSPAVSSASSIHQVRNTGKLLTGFFVCAFAAFGLAASTLFDRVELQMLDWQTRLIRNTAPKPAPNDVTIIAFDDEYLETAAEPFALFHPHLSKLLEAMRIAKPTLLALDIALPEKPFYAVVPRNDPNYDYDRELLKAITVSARDFPILLARTIDSSGHKMRDIQVAFLATANQSPLLPKGLNASASAILCSDQDNVVRRLPSGACTGIQSMLPLAGAMAAIQGNRQNWLGLINYAVGDLFHVVKAKDVMDALARKDHDWLSDRFRNKAVLVGVALRDEDRHATPIALSTDEPLNFQTPGVMVHAQIYRTLMNHGPIRVVDRWVVAFVIALGALFWFWQTSRKKILVAALFGFCVLALSLWLFYQGVYLASGAALLAAMLGLLARGLLDSLNAWHERNRLRISFRGAASPLLMKRIETGEISPNKDGKRALVCVLFCDIRGFTTMSEKLPPQQVVKILNQYFAAVTEAVHQHSGVIDKFIGDGVMALFGEPEPLPNAESAALAAAQEILVRLQRLNDQDFKAIGIKLEIGIGIHSGEAVVGYIGSTQRHEFTAIGDTVNTAARLEGLCQPLGYSIICSDAVARAVGSPAYLFALGEQPLKGRARIAVHGCRPTISV